ncbi:MAG: histidine phosphatase family protein [Steroidobacteraceae bacterium]
MPRQLILLRHAEALPASGKVRDHDRPLSAHGQGQAEAVAHQLLDQEVKLDLILCSSALRTRETAARTHRRFEHCRLEVLEALYNADPVTLRAQLAAHAGQAQCVMLVAHNPGISMLAGELCALQGASGLATAGVRIIPQPDQGDWRHLAVLTA